MIPLAIRVSNDIENVMVFSNKTGAYTSETAIQKLKKTKKVRKALEEELAKLAKKHPKAAKLVRGVE